jgi:hypothetical protein
MKCNVFLTAARESPAKMSKVGKLLNSASYSLLKYRPSYRISEGHVNWFYHTECSERPENRNGNVVNSSSTETIGSTKPDSPVKKGSRRWTSALLLIYYGTVEFTDEQRRKEQHIASWLFFHTSDVAAADSSVAGDWLGEVRLQVIDRTIGYRWLAHITLNGSGIVLLRE